MFESFLKLLWLINNEVMCAKIDQPSYLTNGQNKTGLLTIQTYSCSSQKRLGLLYSS